MRELTRYTIIDSPVGALLLARGDQGLSALWFVRGRQPAEPRPGWVRDDRAFDDVRLELGEYFEGTREVFTIPLAPEGTSFQQRVWQELRRIPYGETISYGELARRIGQPSAVRAVGLANGANPVAIVIPCHRVIGANGTLTGYAGGLDAKQVLLRLEGCDVRDGRIARAVAA